MATLPVDADITPNYTPTQHADHHNTVHAFNNGVVANRQTASYTLVLADHNKVVEMNVAGANNLTVPPNSSVAFPVGTVIEVMQYGAGQTTLVAGSGVTLRSGSGLTLSGQYATAAVRKIATDEWHVIGEVINPQGTLGYTQVTANQTGITTLADLTGLSVTVTVGTGRRIRVTGQGFVYGTNTGDTAIGYIREGSTALNYWVVYKETAAGNGTLGNGLAVLTPSAGSHTYKLSMEAGAGTANLVAGSTRPAFILVEDIGAA